MRPMLSRKNTQLWELLKVFFVCVLVGGKRCREEQYFVSRGVPTLHCTAQSQHWSLRPKPFGFRESNIHCFIPFGTRGWLTRSSNHLLCTHCWVQLIYKTDDMSCQVKNAGYCKTTFCSSTIFLMLIKAYRIRPRAVLILTLVKAAISLKLISA